MPTKRTGRPRGRPKGAKNVPKIEDFIHESLTSRVAVPVVKKQKPRGPCVHMTAEERSEYFRKLREKNPPRNPGRRKGVPAALTLAEFEARKAEQIPIVKRIMKKMADNGQLPDDPRAVEALEKSMVVLRTAETNKDKLAAARLVLDFTKSKPTAKVEHTIKSAEEYLDEIADENE